MFLFLSPRGTAAKICSWTESYYRYKRRKIYFRFMDLKSKNALITIALISTSILIGAVLAPSFLNWGIEKSLPIYGYDAMDKPLQFNQYLIEGNYLTSNQEFIYVQIENKTWVMIEQNTQGNAKGFKLCTHKEGDKVKYAVFAEPLGDNWNKFILRRELC